VRFSTSGFFHESFPPSKQHKQNWWQNMPPVSLIPVAVANLTPVSLIPVVNLDLRISLRFFEKIQNGPNGILYSGAWGKLEKLIHEKTRKKSRDTVPLSPC
jgi:hypothetical protein